jgi:hypothetical protein
MLAVSRRPLLVTVYLCVGKTQVADLEKRWQSLNSVGERARIPQYLALYLVHRGRFTQIKTGRRIPVRWPPVI